MERALLLSPRQSSRQTGGEWDRLYIGHEFCERLLPSDQEIESLVKDRSLPDKRSLVTPYVTQAGLERVQALVRRFVEKEPIFDEVIINDWGVFRAIREHGGRRVLGRLLVRQLRDPRLVDVDCGAQELPGLSISDDFIRVIRDVFGISRIEMDTTPAELAAVSKELHVSLYRPFTYVTTTRLCPIANLDGKPAGISLVADRCNFECVDHAYELRNELMGRTLYLYGNTIFYRNEEEGLPPLGPDRLVIQQLP